MLEQEQLFNSAKMDAHQAVDAFVAKHGEPMYCGFASVTIKPARGGFVDYLKRHGLGGTKSYGGGGYRLSWYDIMENHPYRHTQSMDLREEGCQAFADRLTASGLTAWMESRAD